MRLGISNNIRLLFLSSNNFIIASNLNWNSISAFCIILLAIFLMLLMPEFKINPKSFNSL
ncbi:hypothetical protein BBU72A_D0003 (plasmid) [Borreliella burgdorferi 72a]|nr:hypothetical protein BBU72A_D0003 [Borreliella burgdorferi 72a]